MKLTFVRFAVLGAICICAVDNRSVHAEVTSDNTLKTSITSGSNSYFIKDGTRVGNNLFHSFSEFSIPKGVTASFENATDIQNIFSRVTGGKVSNIDGEIRANGGANLFLINPTRIIFGPNASLNIGGSFVATTANSIKFADGVEFSTKINTTPLLTMSVPIGLQLGPNPGEISVQGSGHRLTSGLFTPTVRTNNPIGLQVKADNTLMLIGGQVNFESGIITTNGGGHLEVGSVSQGQVKLNPIVTGWVGDYSSVQQFNDIHLAKQSLLDASGSNGSIQLQGRNINLSDGSAILLQNLGTQASGGITIKAFDFSR